MPLCKAFHLIMVQMAAFRKHDANVISRILLNALGYGPVSGRRSLVIAHQGLPVIGIGPNDADGFAGSLIQRQDTVFVFQQHHALRRRIPVQLPHRLAVHHAVRNPVVRIFLSLVQHAQLHTGGKQVHQSLVQAFLIHQAFPHCLLQELVHASAV